MTIDPVYALPWRLECLEEGDCWLTDGPAVAMHGDGLLMMMHQCCVIRQSAHVNNSAVPHLDKADNAVRRRYSCDVIKTVRVTEATHSTDVPVQGRAITCYMSFAAFNKASILASLGLLKLCCCIFLFCLRCHFCILDLTRVLILLCKKKIWDFSWILKQIKLNCFIFQ